MEYTKIIEQRVFKFIEKHRMLEKGDRVVVGVSGGADSVCLLFVLKEFASKYGLFLQVVHINHGIRQEAENDADCVKQLCEKLSLPFALVKRDVPSEARQKKCSEEEMGRIARYEVFQQIAEQVGANKIAVAHNANDQAETMLFHLFRGSGLRGLGGMRPVRDQIIRPLLCLERQEIERYLEEKGIPYCTDATNATDAYTRNRIRHHILPFAQTQISNHCIAHMGQTAEMLLEVEEYVEKQALLAYAQVAKETGTEENEESGSRQNPCIRIACKTFEELPVAIQKRLLMHCMERLSGSAKDISYVHVEDVRALFSRDGNGSVSLPYGIRAVREYEDVILRLGEGKTSFADNPERVVDLTGITDREVIIPIGDRRALSFTLIMNKKIENIPQNQYTKWFDYDKIKKLLVVRMRTPGDFLSIRGNGGDQIHQSLKKYLINEKISASERDRIPLLAEGDHILWVIGYRISEFYKVDENTKRILQVQLKEDK